MEVKELKEEIRFLESLVLKDIRSRLKDFKSKTGVEVEYFNVNMLETPTVGNSPQFEVGKVEAGIVL